MAGLYAALHLQRAGYRVHIFEGTDRIGGRVQTFYFNGDKDQFFEAGAMRIPHSPHHRIVFDLIKFIQSSPLPSDMQVNLMPYRLTSPGNFVYINHRRPKGLDASSTTPRSINWALPEETRAKFQDRTAEDLMVEAVSPLLQKLHGNFTDGFEEICREFDDLSFRQYLSSRLGWPTDVIDFLETVASQTNQFYFSVTEIVMEYMDFSTKEWFTIANGMSRLPLAMAHLVGNDNITLNARVTGIHNEANGKVTLSIAGCNGPVQATFDKVIMAIPSSALKVIHNRPAWSERKECAIRSMHFESLYKMGLRFSTRFWERVDSMACRGGQSTTDLPIRWIVYPSNGIGEEGPGVLLVYSWMADANAWLPLTQEERRDLALANLAKIYNGKIDTKDGSTINVYDLFMEASDAVWSERNSTGDAKFLPGQFQSRFEAARRPEGNIYFAGEHLSRHHTWIAGALESAWETVSNIINGPLPHLGPSGVESVEVERKDLVKRPVLTKGPDTVAWESAILAGGHVGDGGKSDVDFVLQRRRKPFGLNLEIDPSVRPGTELTRNQGAKTRRT